MSNIFLRSTRRQPIRTVLLLLLVVVTVFAFTARAAEYLLLRQETERLGSYYKAVGDLSPVSSSWDSAAASFDEVKEFLESDERVAYTAKSQTIAGLLPDVYNADIAGLGSTEECKSTHRYFTGTLLGVTAMDESEMSPFGLISPFRASLHIDWGLCCYFKQEEALAGPPEVIWPGHIVRVFVPREDAAAALQTLQVGKQYLVCGFGNRNQVSTEDLRIEKITVQNPTIITTEQ